MAENSLIVFPNDQDLDDFYVIRIDSDYFLVTPLYDDVTVQYARLMRMDVNFVDNSTGNLNRWHGRNFSRSMNGALIIANVCDEDIETVSRIAYSYNPLTKRCIVSRPVWISLYDVDDFEFGADEELISSVRKEMEEAIRSAPKY